MRDWLFDFRARGLNKAPVRLFEFRARGLNKAPVR